MSGCREEKSDSAESELEQNVAQSPVGWRGAGPPTQTGSGYMEREHCDGKELPSPDGSHSSESIPSITDRQGFSVSSSTRQSPKDLSICCQKTLALGRLESSPFSKELFSGVISSGHGRTWNWRLFAEPHKRGPKITSQSTSDCWTRCWDPEGKCHTIRQEEDSRQCWNRRHDASSRTSWLQVLERSERARREEKHCCSLEGSRVSARKRPTQNPRLASRPTSKRRTGRFHSTGRTGRCLAVSFIQGSKSVHTVRAFGLSSASDNCELGGILDCEV